MICRKCLAVKSNRFDFGRRRFDVFDERRAVGQFPFRDPDLPLRDRVADLLSRLTEREKISLLHQRQPAVPRLGLAEFRTGLEVAHGVAWLGEATVFPQPVGLAASWDVELVRKVGDAAGTEARGFHDRDPLNGLNVWAPVVNPLRDPRWGRNEEAYSEDPVLTSAMGTAFASGLRGDHPFYLKTAPTLKHFLGYNNETRRDTTSSDLRPRVLHEYELPCFRGPVEAGAAVAVMPSYNLVNGRPAHLSPLLESELRTWHPDGVAVVSDAFAPSNIAGSQGFRATQAEGHAAMLIAGVDNCTDQGPDPELTVTAVTEALERHLLPWEVVERAVGRLLALRFRLGEFDPAGRNPHAGITQDVIGSHDDLALDAARAAIVLLRNEEQALPLPRGVRLAVIGTHADTLFEDWYSGTLPGSAVTVLSGLSEFAATSFAEGVDRITLRGPDGRHLAVVDGRVETTAEPGDGFDRFDWGDGAWTLRAAANRRFLGVTEDGDLVAEALAPGGWDVRELFTPEDTPDGLVLRHVVSDLTYGPFTAEVVHDGAAEAVALAREADVAVVVVGNDPHVNGRETQDRTGLDLPQLPLVRAVRAANPRTVLVLVSSYPYALDGEEEHLPAVLWTAHGGQRQGTAVAEALFGALNPSGRLPQAWPRSAADLPDLLDYDIIRSGGTYLYSTAEPLFCFGHGLSYTAFDYGEPAWDGERVTVTVTNTGRVAGAEVVQLYAARPDSAIRQPLRRLQSFRRVDLAPGESAEVELPADALWHWDVVRGRRSVEAGPCVLLVGPSSRDVRARLEVELPGEAPAPRTGPLRATDFDHHSGVRLVDDAVVFPAEGDWIAFHDVTPWPYETPDGTELTREGGSTVVVTALRAGVRVERVV
ncbi:beta-glucosidase [Actinosynnema pretiosum]|nr:beta-glucosidase [Actinosynnema pretiosum]